MEKEEEEKILTQQTEQRATEALKKEQKNRQKKDEANLHKQAVRNRVSFIRLWFLSVAVYKLR